MENGLNGEVRVENNKLTCRFSKKGPLVFITPTTGTSPKLAKIERFDVMEEHFNLCVAFGPIDLTRDADRHHMKHFYKTITTNDIADLTSQNFATN